MKCRKCHAELEKDALFCPECGAKVEQDVPEQQEAAGAADAQKAAKVNDQEKGLTPVQASEAGRTAQEQTDRQADAQANGKAGAQGDQPAAGAVDGAQTQDAAGGAADSGKKKPGLPVVIGGAAAVVVIGGLAIAGATGAFSGGGSDIPKEIMYVQDGGVYGTSLKNVDKEPTEYTDDFADSDKNVLGGVRRLAFQTVIEDGKYRIFPEKYDEAEGTYTLYYQKGKGDPTKLDSGVQGYRVTAANNVVYLKDNNLYVTKLGGDQKQKVDSDLYMAANSWDGNTLDAEIAGFDVSKDGKTLIWNMKAEDSDGYDFYAQDIQLKNKKVKLISDSTMLGHTDNYDSILFIKAEGGLYLSKNLTEAEKLADTDNATGVFGVDMKKGSFFYTTAEEKKVKAAGYVEDDKAEEDAQLQKPNKSDYEYQTTEYYTYRIGYRTYRYPITVTEVRDEYYTKLEDYEDKEARDALRKELETAEITIDYTNLYYYANGTSTLVTPDYHSAVASIAPLAGNRTGIKENNAYTSALLYTKSVADGGDSAVKVKLSEIDELDDIRTRLLTVDSGETQYFLHSGGAEKALNLDEKVIQDVEPDAKNNKLYLLLADKPEEKSDDESADSEDEDSKKSKQDDSYELVTVDLAAETAEPVPYADDVSWLEQVYDGNVYYLKDVSKEGTGDLYRNQENVAYDVVEEGLWPVPYSSAVVYLSDVDDKSGTGTLSLLSGNKKPVEIGTDISGDDIMFTAYGENCIFMMADYDSERGTGDLQYYNGKENKTIDNDVSAYFATYPGQDAIAYFAGNDDATYSARMGYQTNGAAVKSLVSSTITQLVKAQLQEYAESYGSNLADELEDIYGSDWADEMADMLKETYGDDAITSSWIKSLVKSVERSAQGETEAASEAAAETTAAASAD